MTVQGAQARAGGIQEHPIDGSPGGQVVLTGIQGLSQVHRLSLDNAQPQPLGILGHPLQPTGMTIQRPDRPLIPHFFGHVGALAPWGGATVHNPLVGLRIQPLHHLLGTGILHAPPALSIAG